MQQTNNICDACGMQHALTWSEKHRAWLCKEHYNHHNTETLIFARVFKEQDMFPNEDDYSKLLKDTTPPTDVEKEQQRRANALNAAMHLIADNEVLSEAFAKANSAHDFGMELCEIADTLYKYVYGEPDQNENFNTRA